MYNLENLNIEDSTVNKALSILLESIKKVKKEYITGFDISVDGERSQLERCFAYELYHQWSNELANCNNELVKCNNDGLRLNGEISKLLDKSRYQPDMVLHRGQNSCTDQILVCEIKRFCATPKDICEDIHKLLYFLEYKFYKSESPTDRYKGAVFIMTQVSDSELLKKVSEAMSYIEDSFKENVNKFKDKLYLISYDPDIEQSPFIRTLKDAIHYRKSSSKLQ